MSEDTQMTQQESHDNKDSIEGNESQEDIQAKLEDMQKQFNAVLAKNQELLSETKAAKQRAREEAQAKEQAKLEKAKKEGDFEKLLKSSESERQKLAEQYEELVGNINKEKISNQSMKIASELADGHNAELLSEFIKTRLKMTDDGIKVLDKSGELTVSTVDQLKVEFLNDEKYKALIRGTKASGGGSQGSGNSEAASKTMTRSAFEKMNSFQRSDFMKKGGTLTDD